MRVVACWLVKKDARATSCSVWLDVADPVALGADLNALRQTLLADPYFSGVPSIQPERRKTAVAFHAKDDLPEVRREVFRVLLRHEIQFVAVVRDKKKRAGSLGGNAIRSMQPTAINRMNSRPHWWPGSSRIACT